MKNKNIQRYFSSLTHFSTVFEKTKYLSKVVAKFTFLQILTNGKLHNIIDILLNTKPFRILCKTDLIFNGMINKNS